MGFAEAVKIALIKTGVSHSELAERIGTSSQNLSNKLRRDDFKLSEATQIANALGLEFKWTME